jgi:hypothetical protein
MYSCFIDDANSAATEEPTMNTTTITATTDLDTLSLPVDQRNEIEPGCVVYQWTDRVAHHTLTVWEDGRGAYATNSDSQWGDWNGSSLRLDNEKVFIKPGIGEVCCYEGCNRPANSHDCEGDSACEEHAAKSYEWVVLTDLSEGAAWLEADMAEKVEEILASQGWDVKIDEPQRGQAEGTYYRKSDGTLQIVGFTIPKFESLSRALDEASNKAIG